MKEQKALLVMLFSSILLFRCGEDSMPSKSDLSINVTVDPDQPIIGNEVIVTITLENSGMATAEDPQVEMILPSGYTYLSHNVIGSGSYVAGTGLWTLSALEKETSSELFITMSVNNSGDHDITSQVIASESPDLDSTPGNNDPNEDDQVTLLITPKVPSNVRVETYAFISAGDGLEVDIEGNIYATNYVENLVYKIDLEKNMSTFASNQAGAAGMVFDESGNLLVARYSSSAIGQISPDGNSISTFATGVAAPIGVDFDSKGNLYANNNVSNAITRIDSNGNKTVIGISIYNNSSLTVDDQDNIYVSDYDSGVINKINPSTRNEATFTNLNNSGVGFIIYSDGFFYATGIDNHVIYMIDDDGNYEIIAGKEGVSGSLDGCGDVATFTKPNAITATADGSTLYVSGGGQIRVITGFREN